MPRKVFDNIGMSANIVNEGSESTTTDVVTVDEEQKRREDREKAILGDNPETINDNGKRVMARNKTTKEALFFDDNGDEVNIDVIDRLDTAYPEAPEENSSGAVKSGELKVRFTKEVKTETKEDRKKFGALKTIECPLEECENITERQDYVDEEGNLSDAFTITIPKKHYSLVKLLRGKLDGQEETKKPDENKTEV